jgi:hypothetical protein
MKKILFYCDFQMVKTIGGVKMAKTAPIRIGTSNGFWQAGFWNNRDCRQDGLKKHSLI